MTFFASRQFLFFRSDTSPMSFQIKNKMIETPGAKIRENFGKSNHLDPPPPHPLRACSIRRPAIHSRTAVGGKK